MCTSWLKGLNSEPGAPSGVDKGTGALSGQDMGTAAHSGLDVGTGITESSEEGGLGSSLSHSEEVPSLQKSSETSLKIDDSTQHLLMEQVL